MFAALTLALTGLTTKAIIPGIVDDDLACKAFDDSGNATTDDSDDDGNPAPHDDLTTSKFGAFAEAILVTVDSVLPQTLIPVHALAVCDAATEPLLPDHFLPNAETGPPAGVAHGASTASRVDWLLDTVGTVKRSGRLPRLSLSHPQQQPPINFTENGTTPRSSPRRSSL
jgi:hypothetical protein